MQFERVGFEHFDARAFRFRTELTGNRKQWIEHTRQENFLICGHFRSSEF